MKQTYEYGLIVGTKREREYWENKIKNKIKELEEAINNLKETQKTLEQHIRNYEKSDCKTNVYSHLVKDKKAIETVLQSLENSIPKQELEKDLRILQETKVDDEEKFWMKSGIEEYLKKLLEGK